MIARAAPVDILPFRGGIGYAYRVVHVPVRTPESIRASDIERESLVRKAQTAQLGLEVLLLPELFHHPAIALTPNGHCALLDGYGIYGCSPALQEYDSGQHLGVALERAPLGR